MGGQTFHVTKPGISVIYGEQPLERRHDRSPRHRIRETLRPIQGAGAARASGDHQSWPHDGLLHIAEPEYAEYQRLRARARRIYHVSELPEATVQELVSARMSSFPSYS